MSIKKFAKCKKSIDKFAKSNYIIIRVCEMQTIKGWYRSMFRNLEAEQARFGYTNQAVADWLEEETDKP